MDDETDGEEREESTATLPNEARQGNETGISSGAYVRRSKRKRENDENLKDARKFRRIKVVHLVQLSGSKRKRENNENPTSNGTPPSQSNLHSEVGRLDE